MKTSVRNEVGTEVRKNIQSRFIDSYGTGPRQTGV